MKKILLSILLVMLIVCNTIVTFAIAPEMVTNFDFATDFHNYGDEETLTSQQWKYMFNANKEENEDGTYTNYKGYEEMTDWTTDSSGKYWYNSGGRVYGGGLIHSVLAVRVAVVWVAPMSGTISINVDEGEFGRVSEFASELDTDADIVTRIAKTDAKGDEVIELEKVVLPAEREYCHKWNTLFPKYLEVEVAEGDKIYFECHGTGEVRREIIWNPIVNYINAIQYYTDDGTKITSNSEISSGMNINCVFYNSNTDYDAVPMCFALYDSKNRLGAAAFKTVAKQDNKYKLSVMVPPLLNTSTEEETTFSKWSMNITVVSDDSVFKPIYVSDMLVLK